MTRDSTDAATARAQAHRVLQPAVARLIETALSDVAEAPLVCGHLVAAAPLLAVCAAHPSRGLLCPRCLRDEAARHGANPQCMVCGARPAALASWEGRVHDATTGGYPAGYSVVFAPGPPLHVLMVLCQACLGAPDPADAA